MVTTKRKPDFKKNLYEQEAWRSSELIVGIDEVGRSCLSGPVVAAAVLLKPYARHTLLKDSKILSADQREKAFKWIITHSSFAVGITHHRLIDSLNIYHASLVAMNRALMQLLAIAPQQPSLILIDAMPLKLDTVAIPVICFPFGESQSTSIAAASIVAKVTRDALMSRLDTLTPGYGYRSNKGYGTQAHKEGINTGGLSVLHRMSFITNKNHEDKALQLSFTAALTSEIDPPEMER